MRPFERADRNFLIGFANSAICLFEGGPFFSSFLCCKAAPSISMHLPLPSAQHLKLIDFGHI